MDFYRKTLSTDLLLICDGMELSELEVDERTVVTSLEEAMSINPLTLCHKIVKWRVGLLDMLFYFFM